MRVKHISRLFTKAGSVKAEGTTSVSIAMQHIVDLPFVLKVVASIRHFWTAVTVFWGLRYTIFVTSIC